MITNNKYEKTKDKVEQLLLNSLNTAFFEKHFVSLNVTSSTYVILKNTYQKYGINAKDFKKTFSTFYGLKRFVDNDFIDVYFTKMNELRSYKEYSIRKLAVELTDKVGKVQFSFATKLLNIMNDEKYPIYDSYVAKAFGIYPAGRKRLEDKIDSYVIIYQTIMDVYTEMLVKYGDSISEFRNFMGYPKEDLSDLRMVDILIWKCGESLLKKTV